MEQLVTFFCAGVALAAIGAMQALAARFSVKWRTVLSLGCVLVASAVAGSIDSKCAYFVGGLTISGWLACGLLTHSRSRDLASRLGATLQWQRAIWWGLAAGGMTLGVQAMWREDARDAQQVQEDALYFEGISYRPVLRRSENIGIHTDAGRAVPVMQPINVRPAEEMSRWENHLMVNGQWNQVISRHAADDRCNCHGWVFTHGRYWIDDEEVDVILFDNGYLEVVDPRAGDLIIYRDEASQGVIHTGLVRANIDGNVLVESKWGPLGVYLHFAGDSRYGDTFGFYRSAREGHALKGLEEPVQRDNPAVNAAGE